jgi:hypothetical protein
MNKTVFLFAALTLFTSAAQAQQTREKRWRVQMGAGFPTQASGRRFLDPAVGSAGASYDLGRVGEGVWGLYTSGVMHEEKATSTGTGGGILGENSRQRAAQSFGVQYRATIPGSALYYGAGLGRTSVSLTSTNKLDDTTTTVTTEKQVASARLFFGETLGTRYFTEVSYTINRAILTSTATDPVNTSHLSLSAGVRF